MNDDSKKPESHPGLHKPTENMCRDGGEHDWKTVNVSPGYSYYFCQKCGLEKGRPANPPPQCPP